MSEIDLLKINDPKGELPDSFYKYTINKSNNPNKILYNINTFKLNFRINSKKYLIVKYEKVKENKIE